MVAYAVRGRVVLKYLGQLAVAFAIVTLVPALASFIVSDAMAALRYLGVATVLLAFGWPAGRIPHSGTIQTNEALVITAAAFLLAAVVMIYPMTASGLPVLDAFFEAVSGITTTGLTTLASVEDKPADFLFARSWLQWTGGLGIAVLSVVLLMESGIASKRLVVSISGESMATTTRVHARTVLIVYVLLTVVGAGALLLMQVGAFDALTHTLSAVSTGGFSTFDKSLAGFDSMSTRAVVVSIAFCGAISLPLYYRAWRQGAAAVFGDVEFRGLVVLTVIVSIAIALLLTRNSVDGSGPVDIVFNAFLLGVSAQTTTGFTGLHTPDLDSATKAVLIIAMATGGSVGSTAGGVKILRFLILLRLIEFSLIRAGAPAHAVTELRLGGRRLENDSIIHALLLLALFVVVVFLSWIPFMVYGYEPLDALFEVVSATGTVGLSTGITRTELEPLLKGILCVDMLLGRLEIIALLIVLYPGTWLGKRAS